MTQAIQAIREVGKNNGFSVNGDGENSGISQDPWTGFEPPKNISNTHPWISRYYKSAILDDTVGSDLISTLDKEIYGNNDHPIAFRVGNGGAGYVCNSIQQYMHHALADLFRLVY